MMAHHFFNTSNPDLRNWTVLIIPGFVYMLVGLMAFAIPSDRQLALRYIYCVSILVSGLSEFVFYISNRKNGMIWEGRLLGGLLDLIMAVLLIGFPSQMLSLLPLHMGIWLLLRGIAAIWFSLRSKLFGSLDWLWILLFELAIVNFLFLMLGNSFSSEHHSAYITGLAFIAVGAYRLFLVYDIKKIHGFINKYLLNF